MQINRLLCLAVSFILISFSVSCAEKKPEPLLSCNEYVVRYNAISTEFGFSEAVLSGEIDNVCGFAAFDGLFIVCFSTDGNGNIFTCTVSTGSSYSQTLTNENEFNEAVISASCAVYPVISAEIPEESDISKIAGMLLASLESEVVLRSGVLCNSVRTSDGGFKIEITSEM